MCNEKFIMRMEQSLSFPDSGGKATDSGPEKQEMFFLLQLHVSKKLKGLIHSSVLNLPIAMESHPQGL